MNKKAQKIYEDIGDYIHALGHNPKFIPLGKKEYNILWESPLPKPLLYNGVPIVRFSKTKGVHK